MRIGISSYLFSSSTVLVIRLYFRERSSILYIVITISRVVEVSYSAIGRVVMVN